MKVREWFRAAMIPVLIIVLSGGAWAAVWNVPNDYATIGDAVASASVVSGDIIEVNSGNRPEGIVSISKNLTIRATDSNNPPTIVPITNTTGSGSQDPSAGWFAVNAGYSVNFEYLDFDASGYNIGHVIHHQGPGNIRHCSFSNVRWAAYLGLGIVSRGSHPFLVEDCSFSNIERVGCHFNDPTASPKVFRNNVFVGKGPGDNINYGFEAERGARALVENNTISGCTGVAASDGSTSAALLATTYFAASDSTRITCHGNVFTGNTEGYAIGYLPSDYTVAVITGNKIEGNTSAGVGSLSLVRVEATANWWGATTGPSPTDLPLSLPGRPRPLDAEELAGNRHAALDDAEVGDIHYSPWVASSGDDNDPVAPGWQPNLSAVGVSTNGTIQQGINLVNVGGTVNVAAGTYAEGLTLSTDGLVLRSYDGSAVDGSADVIISPPEPLYGITITGNAVTLQGFNIVDATIGHSTHIHRLVTIKGDNCTLRYNVIVGRDSDRNDYLISVRGDGVGDGIADGTLIEGNEIYNSSGTAINVGGTYQAENTTVRGNNTHDNAWYGIAVDRAPNTTVEGNMVANNGLAGMWVEGRPADGRPVSGTVIRNNTIDGNPVGVMFRSAAGVTMGSSTSGNILTDNPVGLRLNIPSGSNTGTPQVNGNTCTGSIAYGVENLTSEVLDASANWWGSSDPVVVAAGISANVDYTPWLDSGTDMSTDPGFQGDFSTLWVGAGGEQTGSVGRVQEGIDLVTGSTVNVAAGTYAVTSTIQANKAGLRLLGPQANVDPRPSASTTRVPGSASEAILDGGGTLRTIIRVLADNVEINGLEVCNGTGDLIDSPDAAPVKQSPAIRHCIIHHSSGDEGVQLRWVDNGVYEYNRVYNTRGDALNFSKTNNCLIQYNECHDIDSQDGAIYCYNDGVRDYIGITIQNNLIYNITRYDGIKLGDKEGRDKLLRGGNILNNIVRDGVRDGIVLCVSNSRVEGNEIYNCNSQNGAIYVPYNVSCYDTIANNYVHHNGISSDTRITVGIRIGHRTSQPSNICVTGNTILHNEQAAFDSTAGNYWDSNCYSDFSSNSGFPTHYNVPGVGNIDLNPNANGCSNVDVYAPAYIGCAASGCARDTLYYTLDLASVVDQRIWVTLPDGFLADWVGDNYSFGAGAGWDPRFSFGMATKLAGNRVEIHVMFDISRGGSSGDPALYIAKLPIVNDAVAHCGHKVVVGDSTYCLLIGPAVVSDLSVASATITVDCVPPTGTLAYEPSAPACEAFGAAGQLVGKFKAEVFRGDVSCNAPLDEAWLTVNGNTYNFFGDNPEGDFTQVFPGPGTLDESTLWDWLVEGCNTLVLHYKDTECNEDSVLLANVGKDVTIPPLARAFTQSQCYNNESRSPQYGGLLLDTGLDIDASVGSGSCIAQTGELWFRYDGTANVWPSTPFSLPVEDYPDSSQALDLWAWMMTQVPGDASGDYTFWVIAKDCAGNMDSLSFVVCIDLTKPANAFTILDARPTGLGVWLKWDWTYDADEAVEAKIFRSVHTGDYPLYNAPCKWDEWGNDADYKQNYYDAFDNWVLVATLGSADQTSGAYPGTHGGPGDAYWYDAGNWDTLDTDHEYRDVYRYVTFVKDVSGNWSQVTNYSATVNADRSTNYWLGDFSMDVENDGDGTVSSGAVEGFDLSLFTASYFKGAGNGYDSKCDIGPETGFPQGENAIGKGIPMPDDSVNFLDLVPFSFNFYMTGYQSYVTMPPPVTPQLPVNLDAQPVVSVCRTDDKLPAVGEEFTVTVALSGNFDNAVKGVEAHLTYDPEVLEYVSVTIGDASVSVGGQLFAVARPVNGSNRVIGVAFAALGPIATLNGDFTLAVLTFRWNAVQETQTELALERVRLFDAAGTVIHGAGSVLAVGAESVVPARYALYQNYPNPFNPSTQIRFDLKESGDVQLVIYNLMGQEVRTLLSGRMSAGQHAVAWNGTDRHGRTVGSGVYIYRLRAGSFVESRKMLLTR